MGDTFPPGKSGGLIEAYERRTPSTPTSRFPPGKSGGLIEASLERAESQVVGEVSAG